MNTQTDVDILSGVQVNFCADKGFSPEGMTMPSTAESTPTGSSDAFTNGSPSETGLASRTGPNSGPSNTSSGMSDFNYTLSKTSSRISLNRRAIICAVV